MHANTHIDCNCPTTTGDENTKIHLRGTIRSKVAAGSGPSKIKADCTGTL